MPHLEPGSIVEFFEEKGILCGVALELKGERLRVLAQNSREFTLPPKRLLHAGPALALDRMSRQELLKRLEDTAREREALKGAINLQELWELLAQENHSTTVAELAELWFGRASADAVAAAGPTSRPSGNPGGTPPGGHPEATGGRHRPDAAPEHLPRGTGGPGQDHL